MVLAHSNKGRTEDVRISNNTIFDELLLCEKTLMGLKNSGFYNPSPIQLYGIPLGKCGFDLLLEAKAGTGKTVVFTVTALEKFASSIALQTIILAPTREIAAQIHEVIKQIGSFYSGLNTEVVMGGLPLKDDIEKFQEKKVHIVVASPGRLRQLIQDKHVNVSTVRLLVLDEADKLLTKSFLSDINYIFSMLPKEKQVIMSSATYTEGTKVFIKNYVQNAQHVCPDSNSILLGVTQKVTTVKHHSNIVKQTKLRFDELLKILSKHSFKQCIIFCNYQARIAELHKKLEKEKWPAQQLYGQQEQLDRLDALKSLQEYKCRILISTDLAARGIDASNVDLVINFEPPFEWQIYLHRIGRAGRFGSYGSAITILSEGQEVNKFIKIVKEIKAPLNLTNLWTEEKFLEDSDNESTQDGSQDNDDKPNENDFLNALMTTDILEVKHDFLWKVLTCDSEIEAPKNTNDSNNGNIDNNIESFSDLCNAFNNLDFESFSDLISSLDTYQSSKSTLDLPVLSQQCIKVIPVEEKTINGKSPIGDTNNSYMNENSNNHQMPKTVEDKVNGRINSIKHINGAVICNTLQNFANGEKFSNTTDEQYTELEQALKDAGLPTAFGSNKYKHQPRNNILYKSKVKQDNHNHFRETKKKLDSEIPGPSTANESSECDSDERVKCNYSKPTKNKYPNKARQPNKLELNKEPSETSDCSETFVAYNNNNKKLTTQNYSSQNEKKVSGNCTYNQTYTKFQVGFHEEKHSKSRYSDEAYITYMNWYNNLKLRVKQVELAVYFEEMSKLNANEFV